MCKNYYEEITHNLWKKKIIISACVEKNLSPKNHYLGISLLAQRIWNLLENFNGTHAIFVGKNL